MQMKNHHSVHFVKMYNLNLVKMLMQGLSQIFVWPLCNRAKKGIRMR